MVQRSGIETAGDARPEAVPASGRPRRPAVPWGAAVLALFLACAPAAPPRDAGGASAGSDGGGTAAAPKSGGAFTYAMSRDITRKGLDPNVGSGQSDIVL